MIPISFGKHSIESQSWETESEMTSFLKKCDAGSILLGQDAQQYIDYFSITVHFTHTGARFGVGIISEGHGLTPQVLLDSQRQLLIIGLNHQVVGIDMTKREASFHIDLGLGALFFQFIPIAELQTILVLHEIGIVAISEDGKPLWEYSADDIIEDWKVKNEKISLKLMDAQPVELDLKQIRKTQHRRW